MKEKKRNTKITSREKKIIRLIALGYTDAEIAETIPYEILCKISRRVTRTYE